MITNFVNQELIHHIQCFGCILYHQSKTKKSLFLKFLFNDLYFESFSSNVSNTFYSTKQLSRARSLVVSDLRSETEGSRSGPAATYVQRWAPAAIARVMSKCLSSGWKWLWGVKEIPSPFPCSPVIREWLWKKLFTFVMTYYYNITLFTPFAFLCLLFSSNTYEYVFGFNPTNFSIETPAVSSFIFSMTNFFESSWYLDLIE